MNVEGKRLLADPGVLVLLMVNSPLLLENVSKRRSLP